MAGEPEPAGAGAAVAVGLAAVFMLLTAVVGMAALPRYGLVWLVVGLFGVAGVLRGLVFLRAARLAGRRRLD